MTPREKYAEALGNLPPSGGRGCHSALLSVVNLGVRAGLSAEQIAADLALNVRGSRKITHHEIMDAIRKAALPGAPAPRAEPRPRVNSRQLLDHIFARGAGFTIERLREASPIRIDWPPERDAIETLCHLYSPDDKIFVGEKFDSGANCIRCTSEWIAKFSSGAPAPPHIIPNTLSGERCLTKTQKPSFRADSCVAKFRFVTIEFDAMPLDRQILFWAGVQLNVAALIHSGSKSVHGWVRADASDAEEWTLRIEQKLFDCLTPLGVDSTCKNESRLSRMPGHFRREKGNWQRLLYLDPVGGPILP